MLNLIFTFAEKKKKNEDFFVFFSVHNVEIAAAGSCTNPV